MSSAEEPRQEGTPSARSVNAEQGGAAYRMLAPARARAVTWIAWAVAAALLGAALVIGWSTSSRRTVKDIMDAAAIELPQPPSKPSAEGVKSPTKKRR
jgi:hypothetical protein